MSQEHIHEQEATTESILEEDNGDQPEADRQEIFDEHFNALMNGFGKDCEENDVNVAVAIADHPEEEQPVVFVRGDLLSAAHLLATVLRNMKSQIMELIDTEP
jgi:hypothetical protein